jgi:23S rRNA G2445 N2-methylase RlmL
MRHRTYKLEHRPASLRPTIAAAMIRLAQAKPQHMILDPMCGAGTILAEQAIAAGAVRAAHAPLLGGDLDAVAVRAAAVNLRRLGTVHLACWDARCLPLAPASVDRIISNPPFGKQLSSPAAIGSLYQRMVLEYDRVLRPGGLAVLLVSEPTVLRAAARAAGWQPVRRVTLRVLGQPAAISVWRKAP